MNDSTARHAALELEIAGEKANSLGRIARRMEAALAELRAFDRDGPAAVVRPAEAPPVTRSELLAVAAEWLWYYVIQREVMGWYTHEAAMRGYEVPDEVRVRMGPRRPG